MHEDLLARGVNLLANEPQEPFEWERERSEENLDGTTNDDKKHHAVREVG
jgi:hypothetical protein